MHKDVIIIGSGLGGLSTGVVLAKNGYNVTVVEQGTQIGGCLQCFTRRGVKFETGMHFIGSAAPGQTLDKLMHYLEISDKVQLSRLSPSAYDVISLAGEKFEFANGREDFIKTLASRFPDQRQNLERYYDLIEKVANASSLHSLKYAETTDMVDTTYQLCSIDDVLQETITNPLLANVLVGTLPLYAAERGKTPFSTHAFIMDFYNQSAFRIVGGSDSIARALAENIELYGGKVLTRSKAVKIHCDEEKAKGVELVSGAILPCDYVISAIHPMRTLELLDTKLIRPAFRKRINSIPQTTGGFSVYLKFKENSMPYMNYNFYGYKNSTPWDCEHYDDLSWPKGYLYMHMCHKDKAEYAKSGVILSYMNYADVEKWSNTTIGHRGADYEEFKNTMAEKLLNEVEKDFPGLRTQIEAYYTATPLTYRDYTGTEGGGMYGIAKDINMAAAYRVSQRLKVPNVLQTGQNINSHGMLGVLVGTIVTCSELLTSKTIYQQILETNI